MHMEQHYSLCPNCDNCPKVVITDECVCIGEGDNTARLSHSEWNELVAAVRRGDLTVVDVEAGS
jgi:hypothetical protein